MNSIQAVILDIGGVVLELDWSKSIHLMKKHSHLVNNQFPKFISKWDIYDQYERGKVQTNEFLIALKAEFNFEGSLVELEEAWNELIVQPVQGIEAVLKVLNKQMLFGLSNTNKAHYSYILNHFTVYKYFNKIFTSFELELRKPEPEIFLKVASMIKVDPNRILFVDDSKDNLEVAKKVGIHSEFCLNSSQVLLDIFSKYNLIS